MVKQKKKKRKLKVGRLVLLLIILVAVSFACYKFIDIPIRSITITGNKILSDQEVLEIAKLDNYPSFLSVISIVIDKKLESNPYVKKAEIKKGFLSVNIKITENKVLYVDKSTDKKIMLESEVKDNKTLCVPYLINTVPKNKQTRFLKAMNKINKNILCQMSEIKYDPNEIDEDRYYVYMNDGNGVYLTLNKFKKINNYNTILENIGKQNGTLYLDYGDYFEAK